MISIIVTTFKEKETLPKAIEKILEENIPDSELIVVGPDEETEKIVKEFKKSLPSSDNRSIYYLKDKGIGKPAALNLAFQKAKGQILVLTDGDVFIEKGAIKKLLQHFKNEKIGAVSGCPVSVNSRKNVFGYWSHFLTETADFLRKEKARRGEYLDCSGYLYAIKNIIKKIPENTLVEDSIISQMIWQKGYKIAYEPEAKVYVKYPDNFSDWLKQKIRSTGGHLQKINIVKIRSPMRGFFNEIRDGFKIFFIFPKNIKEFCWTILLYLARLYLWLLIFWQIKICKKISWLRVESTK